MKKDKDRVCPVWMAYTFDNPLRKLIRNPKKMFKETKYGIVMNI